MPQVKYGISVTFDAPLTFVYKWCTDFHADDPKIIGAPYTRHVIEKTKSRAIWIQHYSRGGVEMEGVRICELDAAQIVASGERKRGALIDLVTIFLLLWDEEKQN